MNKIDIPPVIGPGSQPPETDGAHMDFMHMPSGMNIFESPLIPEAEEIGELKPALTVSVHLLEKLKQYRVEDKPQVINLDHLDPSNRHFFDQLLGEGEVSVQCSGDINALVQESLLAGVWRVQYIDETKQIIRDTIEVAAIPGLVSEMTFSGAQDSVDIESLDIPDDVYNAAPLLAEINEQLPLYLAGNAPYVINLSLLPHTERDIAYLAEKLGIGPVIVLSRGYGNCRISSTGTRNAWWVQYFNSQETLILNTLEISQVPDVACASQEDIEDSAQRLQEILSIYE